MSRQQPPHNLVAEAAILSHLMARRGAASVAEASDYVSAECFYGNAHRRIFEAIVSLAQDKLSTDVVSVVARLEQLGRLHEAGDVSAIEKVAKSQPVMPADAFRTHLMAVRNSADRRELLGVVQRAEAAIYSGVPNHLEFMTETEKQVKAVVSRASAGKGAWVPLKDTLREYAVSLRENGGKSPAVRTGIEVVDNHTGGLFGGDLTIVAARPGMGKTSFALGCAEGVAMQAGPNGQRQVAAMFSLEMTSRELALRLVCSRESLSFETVRKGLPQDQMGRFASGFAKVGKLPFHTDDTSGLGIEEVRRRTMALATRCEREDNTRLAVVVIDYLQLMSFAVAKHENQADAIGNVTKALKGMAKDLQIPVVLLSQLNREVESREDKRPKKSDLRGSGRIEEDADNIWLLYRHEYYHPGEAVGETELIMSKMRGAPPGTLKLHFNGPSTSFERKAPAAFDEDGWHHNGSSSREETHAF